MSGTNRILHSLNEIQIFIPTTDVENTILHTIIFCIFYIPDGINTIPMIHRVITNIILCRFSEEHIDVRTYGRVATVVTTCGDTAVLVRSDDTLTIFCCNYTWFIPLYHCYRCYCSCCRIDFILPGQDDLLFFYRNCRAHVSLTGSQRSTVCFNPFLLPIFIFFLSFP